MPSLATEFSEVGFLGADLKVDSPLPSARGYVAATLEELGDPWIRRADEVVALLVQLDEDVSSTVPVLNHGDFKPANLFLDSNGRLVVLDWEFAFSGPHLFDLGQLFRWGASKAFRDGFTGAYPEGRRGLGPHNSLGMRSSVLPVSSSRSASSANLSSASCGCWLV